MGDSIGSAAQRLSGAPPVCLTHKIHVVDQPGPTQTLWKGTETLETAPSVAPGAEFVFVFDQPVALDKIAASASAKLQSCDSSVSAHDIALQAAWTVKGNLDVVTFKHSTQFIAGCKYTLSIPGDHPVADVLQCLDQPVGFTFRVRSKDEDSPLRKEATSIRYRPKTFDVSAFSLPEAIQASPSAIVQRYSENLGIRPYVDTFAVDPTMPKRLRSPAYAEYYLGVPVTGAGYVFQTDVNGNVTSATGRISQGISLDVHPLVLDAAALVVATNEVLKTQKFAKLPILLPSSKTLVIQPVTAKLGTPPKFRLAWAVRLVDQVSHAAFNTVVDAQNASILVEPASNIDGQCANTDTSGLAAPAAEDGRLPTTLQSTLYRDPDDYSLSRFTNGGSSILALRTDGVAPFALPTIAAQCGLNVLSDSTYATVPSTLSDASWSPEVLTTAASFLGVQRTYSYLAAHPLKDVDPGTPSDEAAWVGFDGDGAVPIRMLVGTPVLGNPPQIQAYFDPNANLLHFVGQLPGTSLDLVTNAALDITGHEFGHAVLHSLYPETQQPETLAIGEGFGDVLGSTVEQSVRGDGPWNYCLKGDVHQNAITTVGACLRDLQNPQNSAQGPSPSAFGDGNYSHSTDPQIVGHLNSTVMGHWFYLLQKGTSAPNTLGCTYDLSQPPLTWDESLAVVFHAVESHLFKDHDFNDLATATVSAAKILFQADPNLNAKVTRVVNAWAAVGVYDPFWEGVDQSIAPGTQEEHVSPWQPIEWDVAPTETAWQLEIEKDDPTLQVPALVSVTETFVGTDGRKKAVARVALDPNSQYYWREHATAPTAENAQCKATHAFMTGDNPTVDDLKIVANLAPDGSVRPGTVEAQWKEIPGAVTYKVFAGTGDPNCAKGTGVLPEVDVPGSLTATEPTGSVSGIQPTTTYTLDVQAVGPTPIGSATAAVTACAATTFATIAMRPPTPSAPVDGTPFPYQSPHLGGTGLLTWTWTGFDGPSSFSLNFYERSLNGTCSSTLAHNETIPANCGSGLIDCFTSFSKDVFAVPPIPSTSDWANPTGYCWTVTSIAGKGQSSPPVPPPADPHFSSSFSLDGPQLTSPGIPLGSAADTHAPVTTNLRDYEDTSDVAFNWSAVPNASGYVIVGGRWPWLAVSAVADPPNCILRNTTTGADSCQAGPAEITFGATEVDGATTTTVPTDKAGRGRYCWTVWPELEDPKNPGQKNPVQPLVNPQANTFCYSTQAAVPVITTDKPTPDGGDFSAEPITGKIVFPYQPGGIGGLNVDFGSAHGSVIPTPACTVTVTGDPAAWHDGVGFVFGDIYNCEYDFTLDPDPDTDYKIVATASGFNQQKLTATKKFTTGQCGGQGQVCCPGNKCTADSTFCDGGTHKCDHCGGMGERCCDDGTCGLGDICNSTTDTCEFCGAQPGQPCCDDPKNIAALGGHQCRINSPQGPEIACSFGKCVTCGNTGETCCDGDTCIDNPALNLQCVVTNPLQPATSKGCEECGHDGTFCCAHGTQCENGIQCDPVTNNCCDSTAHSCGQPMSTCTPPVKPTGLRPGTFYSGALQSVDPACFSSGGVAPPGCDAAVVDAVPNGKDTFLGPGSLAWNAQSAKVNYDVELSCYNGAQSLVNVPVLVLGNGTEASFSEDDLPLAETFCAWTVRAFNDCGSVTSDPELFQWF